MNLLLAFLKGSKERLTKKELKIDAIVVSALVLILAVVGTITVYAQTSSDSQKNTSVASDDPRRSFFEQNPTSSATPESSATPSESSSPSESATPSPTPESPSPSPSESATASPEPTLEEILAADRVAIEAVEPVTSAAPAPVAPAPVVPAPVAPVPVAPVAPTPALPAPAPAPVAPAPVPAAPAPVTPAPSPAYPVTNIPSAQYKTTIHLNMRSGPGSEYGVIDNGATGTTVTTTGRASGIWYEVTLRGKTGWMSSQYLRKVETGENSVASLQAFAGSKLNNNTQLQCLVTLWERESNWNYTAINPAFSPRQPATPFYQAYGIAQAAPGNKMSTFGSDWETNPRTQILWGLDYISGRYGTPCKALEHSYAKGWY